MDVSSKLFGGWASDKTVVFYMFKKKKVSERPTCLSSSVKPSCERSSLFTMNDDAMTVVSYLKFVGKEIKIDTQPDLSFPASENVVSIHRWGSVIYWLRKAATNEFQLEESGPLNFGVQFSSAIKLLYDAISYVPRKGKRNHLVKLTDSI